MKPKIRFLPEIEKRSEIRIFEKLRLNHQKFRYTMHPIHFNKEKFVSQGIIEIVEDIMIMQYDGANKAQLILNDWKQGSS